MEESWQEARDNTEAKSDGRNWRAKRGRKKNVSGGRKRNPAAKAAGRPLTGRRVRPERRPLATLDRERLPLARRTWNRRSSSSPDQPVRRRQIRTGPASSCLPTSRLSRHLPVGGHAHTAHITREGDVALQVKLLSFPTLGSRFTAGGVPPSAWARALGHSAGRNTSPSIRGERKLYL
jgi:hypothetical protein